MSQNNRLSKLEESNIRRFSNLICAWQRCNKPLVVGDSIITKNRGRCRIKHYHLACYSKMFF